MVSRFPNDFPPTALFLFTYSLRIDAGPVYSVLFTGGVSNGVGHILKSYFRASQASTAAHHALVRWVDGQNFGLEFTGIRPAQRERLRSILMKVKL